MRLSQRIPRPLVPAALLIIAAVAMQAAPLAHANGSTRADTDLVKTAPAHILTTAQGMTLYVFSPDKHNKSVCTGACAKFWPPLLLPKGMKAPSAMAGMMGTFGVAPRAGGARQLTYDGAPLYTFLKDKKAGDMTGQGVAGTWWVVVAPSR